MSTVRTDRRVRRGGPRGKSNGNERGSSRDRAARKKRLIARYPARRTITFIERVLTMDLSWQLVERSQSVPIEGKTRCYACGTLLDETTVTVDRIIPGAKGGRYVDENVRPSCATCNSATAVLAKSLI